MVYFSVPTSGEELPTHTSKPRRRFGFLSTFAGRGSGGVLAFLATAALTGVVFHLLVFGVLGRAWSAYRPSREHGAPPSYDNTPPLAALQTARPHDYTYDYDYNAPSPAQTYRPVPEGIATAPPPNYHEMSLQEMRDMVSKTRGFFARDFSLGLGWNNMRYIVEAALLQAQLLNRTLLLPSFIYARACEYPIDVCAEYATMVNKGDAIGWQEWRNLPIEQQMGWRTPMSLMLNITKIREKQPVLLISDYLRLHGRSPDEERSNGAWHRDFYHTHANVFETNKTKLPSLFVVENRWYDPQGVIRVDHIPEDMKARGRWDPEGDNADAGERGHWPKQPDTKVSQRLTAALPEGKFFMDFDKAKQVLRDGDTGAVWDLSSDELVIDLLQKNGWELLYTFLGALGADYTKTVVNPLLQVVPRSSIRGWTDEYARETADVLVLAGETHLYRKPGAMRFTSPAGQHGFQDTVLNHLTPVAAVDILADRLAARMRERVNGRLWMGAHMRRGDFVRLGWAMDQDPAKHVERVKDRLSRGKQVLDELKTHELEAYDIPWVSPNTEYHTLAAPYSTDPFYVATDERDPEALDVIGSAGAVFMTDLLTMDDLREFGWPLMLTDYRALVEQHLLAHSAYFYAHAMSSVAGGIVNMRAVRGADHRTALLD